MNNIRNFVIIAHIDSGKSTLADRLLEITGTVPMRSMRAQYLDRLPLERERGITIKMAPVRMQYTTGGKEYILNLIDTPGHSDFAYEVSRALTAVEGGIILVDATKGIQAQTLSTFRAAQKAGLTLIPAVNKVDLDLPQLESVIQSTADLLGVPKEKVFRISAKTGLGVKELLEEVVELVPPPNTEKDATTASRALIFDSLYDDHKGIIAFMRVMNGEFGGNDDMELMASKVKFKPKEVGYFSPDLTVSSKIKMGEIGYIATGLKEPTQVGIGDTIVTGDGKKIALPGYREVSPVVFISFYPDGNTKFDDLQRATERLHLTDAALSFEPDANEALGRGLKIGFLGQLHFEITVSRLKDEFKLEFLTSFPSIAYRVQDRGVVTVIKQPQDFPDKPEKVWEPIVDIEILVPQKYLSPVVNLQTVYDIEILQINNIGENLLVEGTMPLRELIRDFDDRLKSVSQGYASFTYELTSEREADVEKLEVLIVEEVIPALTRIVPKKDVEREGRQTVERLKELLPKQQFSQALQAKAVGRIVARETIPAMKKALGDFGKNGGDRTRKMKLWKKQERGKERLQATARVNLSPEVFREILKK